MNKIGILIIELYVVWHTKDNKWIMCCCVKQYSAVHVLLKLVLEYY